MGLRGAQQRGSCSWLRKLMLGLMCSELWLLRLMRYFLLLLLSLALGGVVLRLSRSLCLLNECWLLLGWMRLLLLLIQWLLRLHASVLCLLHILLLPRLCGCLICLLGLLMLQLGLLSLWLVLLLQLLHLELLLQLDLLKVLHLLHLLLLILSDKFHPAEDLYRQKVVNDETYRKWSGIHRPCCLLGSICLGGLGIGRLLQHPGRGGPSGRALLPELRSPTSSLGRTLCWQRRCWASQRRGRAWHELGCSEDQRGLYNMILELRSSV